MKFYLQRVRLNQGGYDRTGQYWGIGQPLYWYESIDSDEIGEHQDHIRADNREHAISKIRAKFPLATFFN